MITSKYYEQLPTPFRFQLIHVLRPIMGARKCEKQFGRVIKTLYISNIWKLMNSTANPAKCYRKVNEFSLESSPLHASPWLLMFSIS